MDKYKLISISEALVIIVLIIITMIMSARIESMDEFNSKSDAVQVEKSLFGKMPVTKENVMKYTLRNKNGFEVSLISFGAIIQSILVADKNNQRLNIALGFDVFDEYLNQDLNPYFGGIVGRVANRISNAQFTLNGQTYKLDKNNGKNTLHGGKESLYWQNWRSEEVENGVKFSITSEDGAGGFPGRIEVEVTYRLDARVNAILIDYRAKTNKATPIDLTNHCYFNLDGHTTDKKIYDHLLKINANLYLKSNLVDLVPTGDLESVESTKYDFRDYKRLGDRIKTDGKWPDEGFDNFFIIDQQSGLKHAASVKNPSNGIRMDLWTDQNGVQFYSSNFLNTTKPSNGETYGLHQAFCLETHNLPDAVNKPKFPSSIVRPEGEYGQHTKLMFTTVVD